jgi:putative transposase
MFAGEIRRQRVSRMRGFRHWRWHLDEVYVKINGEMRYLWRAVDHEGEVLESFVTRTRDKAAALTFMKKALKRHGSPETITTDGLRWHFQTNQHFGSFGLNQVQSRAASAERIEVTQRKNPSHGCSLAAAN